MFKFETRGNGKFHGKVYFVQSVEGGPVKIGYSNNPVARLKELQIAHWEELEILAMISGSVLTERQLHMRFEHLRIRGEWFEAAPELLDYIYWETLEL